MRRTLGETGFLRLCAAALRGRVARPLAAEDFCGALGDAALEDTVLCGEVAPESICSPEAAPEERGFVGVDSGVDEEPAACAEARPIMTGQHRSAAASMKHSWILNRTTFLYRGDATRQRFCPKPLAQNAPAFIAGSWRPSQKYPLPPGCAIIPVENSRRLPPRFRRSVSRKSHGSSQYLLSADRKGLCCVDPPPP